MPSTRTVVIPAAETERIIQLSLGSDADVFVDVQTMQYEPLGSNDIGLGGWTVTGGSDPPLSPFDDPMKTAAAGSTTSMRRRRSLPSRPGPHRLVVGTYDGIVSGYEIEVTSTEAVD